mmetsp:Transcript_10875/g.17939  ORF Transcript_10875/g.17939 Transcript_10875/m.17939 type:complete len:632 (-) Transcript_10875:77-1972(-)
MKALHHALLTLLLSSSSPTLSTADLMIGDQVCMTGFIMDTFCINRGTLLDNRDVTTLQNPELHSYHCLLDLGVCINSGYQVLGSKDPMSGLYCPGLRIDDTDAVLMAGRAHGTPLETDPNFFQCDTCTGPDKNPTAGYRATIIGTVKELGEGMGRTTGMPGTRSVLGTPILTNIQVLDSMVKCDESIMVTVEADENDMCLIRSVSDDAGDTNTMGNDGSSSSPPPMMEDTTTTTTATTTTTTTTTSSPPAEVTTTPATAVVENDQDCSIDFCETTLTDGYTLKYKINEADATITMEATYDGEAWLGIAFSEDERMGGSDGILGTPDDGTPQKYRLNQGFIEIMPPEEQTLTDASVEIVDGKTVMKFTKPLVEPNQIPITAGEINMLWANGGDGVTNIGYHGQNRAPVKINVASGAAEAVSAPNMGAWLAHGICAFIAWGLLAPTAVNSAIYRSLFKGPLWFKLHQFFNASAYALTVVAFAIALAFVSKEGNPHWFSSHAKMGLSMFIIASVQVLWGAVRPHLPDSGDEKSTIRKVWEIKHRLTGTVLLACGFWQMSAGIKLFAIKYSGVGSVQEQGVTIAYWIWIAVEVALLLVGGVHFKLLKKPVEEDDGNDATNAAADTVEGKQKEDAV